MPLERVNEEKLQAIQKLKLLKRNLDSQSAKSRIEFAVTVFQSDLYQSVISHDLFDHGVSGRDFDTCFEMGDGDVVVHGIMREALANDTLRLAIVSTGNGVWGSWLKRYESIEKQQDMFSSAFSM